MKFRRIITSTILFATLMVQFLPGTAFTSRPAAAASCDAAQFVADVTIPDGTVFAPGAAMVKTWRLKNVGTCTWSTSYAIVFYSGAKMGAPSVVNLPTSVAPGASVDVSVSMTAPSTAGSYRGHWMLRNASSVLFGVGPYGTYTFFIDIVVAGGSSSTAYDFVANYCAASWSSGAGALPCPGADGDARGFVINLPAPKLEDSTTGPAGLLTAPQNITDGYIQGVYPAFTVQSGDHFISIINCQYGATGCYVTFQLNYQVGGGPVQTLKSFKEKIEGMYYNLDVNLSGLAGQNVSFILKILATGSPVGDRAVWAGARIARAGGAPPPVSTCDKAGFIADVTVPDGTEFTGGTAFVKTWRLQNVGTCTWTTSYKLVFAGGDYLGVSGSAFNLPSSVAPGGTIDLSLNLTAPISAGMFTGYWQLRNATGTNFGVGASGTSSFMVKINVNSAYGSAYDFVTNAASATWSSGAGALSFPGTDGDGRGFPLPLGSHQMEDGGISSEGLITFPQYVTDGYIQGIYPAFTVQSGDHFQSYVGCRFGGPADCYVIFRLAYQIGAGPVTTLKTAAERQDLPTGLVYRMDVDLSSLAGSSVKFILRVESFGSPSGDRAVWSAPRIIRSGGASLLASTTTITADAPDPSAPSQTVAVSATVTGSGGTPTGTVAITGADTNCTITLSGGSGSCNVVFTSAGAKTLTGTYSGNSTYATSSDTETHTVSTGLTASVTTITSDAPDSSIPGQSVAVVVTVGGAGPVPTGTVAITGADTNCTITLAGGTGTCNVVFNTAGSKTLTAVYSGDLNYSSSSDTESHNVSTIVGPNADLSITINDGISTYTLGGTTTYTVVVNNAGPSDVTGAVVNIVKPLYITSWTVSCIADAGASCTAGPVTTAVNISDSIDLPVGKKVTYTILSTISGGAIGNLVTTAAVTNPGPTPDPNVGNNSATDTDAAPSADLAITINDGITVWTPGGSTTYTVVVTNNGPLAVSGATFADNRPAQVTTWSWTCVADAGASCGAGSGGAVATNITDTVNIPAGKKVTYTIVASLGTAVPGNLVNTVTITEPVGMPDPVPANNSASDSDTGPTADLSVTKTDGVSVYSPGDTLTYTIRVFNNGPFAVNGVLFTDNRQLKVTSWTWTGVPDISATCAPCGGAASPFISTLNLPVGQGVTFTVVAHISGIATGNLVNIANVTAPGAIPDPNPANNTATDTDIPASADLAVTITDGLGIYPPGGTVTYTIVVSNLGPQPVVNGTIDDPLPVQISSWNWTCVPDSGASCTAGPQNMAIAFHDTYSIPSGKKVTYTVTAPVSGAFVGVSLVNTVTVTAPVTVEDSVLGNNTATDTDEFPSADLAVTISDGVPTYTQNGTVIYTITLTNSGPSNVTAVGFSTLRPATVIDTWSWTCAVFLGATASTCSGSGAVNITDTVSIPAGGQIVYTVTAHIDIAATDPLITNPTINLTAPSALFTEINVVNNSATDTNLKAP